MSLAQQELLLPVVEEDVYYVVFFGRSSSNNMFLRVNEVRMDGADSDTYVDAEEDLFRLGQDESGGLEASGSMHFGGFWDRVLTDAEMDSILMNFQDLTLDNFNWTSNGALLSDTEVNLANVWRFDETTGTRVDIISGDDSLTETDMAFIEDEFFGQVVADFNGTTSEMTLTKPAWISSAVQELSISIWAKFGKVALGYIVGLYDDTEGGIRILGGLDGLRVDHSDGTNDYSMVAVNPGEFIADRWYHIMVVTKDRESDEATQFVYVDGDLRATLQSTASLDLAITNDLTIGSNGVADGFEDFEGQLRHLYVWTTALGQQYAQALYNGGFASDYRIFTSGGSFIESDWFLINGEDFVLINE